MCEDADGFKRVSLISKQPINMSMFRIEPSADQIRPLNNHSTLNAFDSYTVILKG